MTPERWGQIRDLLHSTMQLKAEDRPAYLDLHCLHDATLRRELDHLLAVEAQVGSSFLEPVAAMQVATQLVSSSSGCLLAAGTQLGPYVVQELLGAGGMGEVYRARDVRLNRIVAIKVIPASLSSDPLRRQRLQREAQAISAVQHPNICSLFDIGQHDGTDYLVMEFLEGQTLGSRLGPKSLPLELMLRHGIEIADALDAAHRRGIIHRDLKPGNIFVTSRGECKVLDFGLAQMESEYLADTPTATRQEKLSTPGVALGTVPYMSPEQARGEVLDNRTDIFSFGAVLYEMATGQMAFPGKTSAVIFQAILDTTPPPPTQLNQSLPARVDEVVGKCLEKDRDLRYQSAAELRTDLKRIQRDTGPQRISTVVASSRLSSPRRSQSKWIILGAVAAILIVAAFAVYHWRRQPLAKIAFEHYSITPLTSTGNLRATSISGDGRYLVYSTVESDLYSLWVQQIATSTNVRVLGPMPRGVIVEGPRFSPDGVYIYFFQSQATSPSSDIYRLAAVGGTPVKVLSKINGGIAISPDGSKVAITRENLKVVPPEYPLSVADIDGTNEKQLLTLKGEALYGAVWSPDGKTLLIGIDELGEGNPNALAVVSLRDRTEHRFVHHMVVFGRSCLSDGSGLVIASPGPALTGNNAILFQLWTISVPDGKLRKLTNDLNDYRGVSLTTDSMRLASSQKRTTSSIWIATTSNLAQATEITTGAGQRDGIRGLTWLPDGGLLYESSGPTTQIWRMDRDGNNRKQLTHLKDSSSDDASITTDGSTILFSHAGNVWRMDADGSDARPVTNSKRDAYNGEISPDGRWLTYYTSSGTSKVSLQGGDPVSLDANGGYPAISRDGHWIAFEHWDEKTKSNLIEIVASDGNGSPRFLPFLPGTEAQQPDENLGDLPIRWTASGDALTYVRTKDGVSNLWTQPINGGPAKQITHFTSGLIWRHAWSPDGKYLALARGNFSIDAVMLTDLR